MKTKEIELWLEKAKGEMQVDTNGEMYFTDKEVVNLLLKYSDLTNAKLVEENEILKEANNNKATYVEEMESELSALKEENERLKHKLNELEVAYLECKLLLNERQS